MIHFPTTAAFPTGLIALNVVRTFVFIAATPFAAVPTGRSVAIAPTFPMIHPVDSKPVACSDL